jgi:hypothetical protein
MPTVLRDGPYAFLFYSMDGGEPKHIHVKRGKQDAKFWLEPISLARNKGFAEHELRSIERLVAKHHSQLMSAWDDYFGP